MVVGVDGYINGAGGEFIAPAWSADLDLWTQDAIARLDTPLYGRVGWQALAEYRPAAEADPETSPPAGEMDAIEAAL